MERLHKYVFWIPLPLLGFDPLMIFTMMSISLFYPFWLHTELFGRLPAWSHDDDTRLDCCNKLMQEISV